MPGLMKTVDAMNEERQALVKAMSDAAREVMREHGLAPKNDDRAAIFDEACGVFLSHSLPKAALMTNRELVEALEFDRVDDEMYAEIDTRKRLGGWLSWDEQREILREINPAYRAANA